MLLRLLLAFVTFVALSTAVAKPIPPVTARAVASAPALGGPAGPIGPGVAVPAPNAPAGPIGPGVAVPAPNAPAGALPAAPVHAMSTAVPAPANGPKAPASAIHHSIGGGTKPTSIAIPPIVIPSMRIITITKTSFIIMPSLISPVASASVTPPPARIHQVSTSHRVHLRPYIP